ncbi:hypothetical protein OY671_008339, partial [Metschnikowia pulcherrima]
QGADVAVTSGSNTTTTAVTFPIAFPNACLSVTGNQTTNASGSWFPLVLGASSRDVNGFTLRADVANPSVNIGSGVTANYFSPSTGCFYPDDIDYPNGIPTDAIDVNDADFAAAMARGPGDTSTVSKGRVRVVKAPE